MELYFYGDLNRDGCAIFYCGRKLPLLYGVDGCVIEIGVQRSRDCDIGGHPIGTDHQFHFNRAFATYVLLRFRELGIRRVNLAWRGDTGSLMSSPMATDEGIFQSYWGRVLRMRKGWECDEEERGIEWLFHAW